MERVAGFCVGSWWYIDYLIPQRCPTIWNKSKPANDYTQPRGDQDKQHQGRGPVTGKSHQLSRPFKRKVEKERGHRVAELWYPNSGAQRFVSSFSVHIVP